VTIDSTANSELSFVSFLIKVAGELNVDDRVWDALQLLENDGETVFTAKQIPEQPLSEVGDANLENLQDSNLAMIIDTESITMGQTQILKKFSAARPSDRGSEEKKGEEEEKKVDEEQKVEERGEQHGGHDAIIFVQENRGGIPDGKKKNSCASEKAQFKTLLSKEAFAELFAENVEPNDQVAREKLRNALLNLKTDDKLVEKIYADGNALKNQPEAVGYLKPRTCTEKSVKNGETGGPKSDSANSGNDPSSNGNPSNDPSSNLPPSSNVNPSSNVK